MNDRCEKGISFSCFIIAETISAQMCWTVLFPREDGVIFVLGKIRNVFRKQDRIMCRKDKAGAFFLASRI